MWADWMKVFIEHEERVKKDLRKLVDKHKGKTVYIGKAIKRGEYDLGDLLNLLANNYFE